MRFPQRGQARARNNTFAHQKEDELDVGGRAAGIHQAGARGGRQELLAAREHHVELPGCNCLDVAQLLLPG